MRIIAQKSNTFSTTEFFYNSLAQDYIDAMSFNVTYTKDNKIVVYNATVSDLATTYTINNNSLENLQDYEISLLDTVLKTLNNSPVKKDIYINLSPSNLGILSDENIQAITDRMNQYVEEVKAIIEQYKNLHISLHSVNGNIVSILKRKMSNYPIGFAVNGNDLNFVDVDYYVLISNTQNDVIIDTLLNKNKEVIIYISSDYYISYLYEHYLGEKSTPYLQETFEKLGFMTNYPDIIHKMFET